MAGDLTKRMDPYFPFEKSVEMWGRSFGKLGISYKDATMDLDLLDRKSKYSNGFCHWPQPAYVPSAQDVRHCQYDHSQPQHPRKTSVGAAAAV